MNLAIFKSRRNIRNIVSVGIAIIILYIGGYYLATQVYVPSGFYEARQKSALIAKEIVSANEQSIDNLEKIAAQDRQYNFSAALVLVEGELERSRSARLKAVDLAKELDMLARTAAEITPTKARNLAISAISSELSLISRLLVYNDLLNGLLKILEFKFSGDIRYDSEEVQTLVKNMNTEAKEVNKLNDAFNQKMKKFDELVK